ncbi:hypothetical protein EXIGUO8H_320008 [Exiguobacterium sp. 8H]|nr:hypothetical protein EXIGUO8H_320008 [Exiguobacterium sp. 8H]VXC04765.1 hypothetical protein EXIGUO8A_730007 [Exiguobacterium sp. 8A]
MRRPVTGLNLPGWLRLRPEDEWVPVELLPASVDIGSGTTIFLLRLGLVPDEVTRRQIAHLAYSSKERRDGVGIRVRLSDGRVLEWSGRIEATRYEDVYVRLRTSGPCVLR